MAKTGIIDRLKTAYQVLTDKQPQKIMRCQYNMMIDYQLVLGIKVLAATIKLPQYVICEHIMESGINFLLESVKTQEQQQKLREHLVNVHLLGRESKVDC